MNWLAHLYLSEPSPEFRIGNLLPDLLKPPQWRGLSVEILRGIECHQKIDAFTDSHPVFRRSIERLDPSYRRVGGILMDMFYDHFLATRWGEFSSVTLEEFAAEVYESFPLLENQIPENVSVGLKQMKATNLLCSYAELSGIEAALARIGARFREPIQLGPAVSQLERHSLELNEDFSAFFPALVKHIQAA
jgi:acyl carrier protein phosphodiesterase